MSNIGLRDLIEVQGLLLDLVRINFMNVTPNDIRDLQYRAGLMERKIRSAIPNVAVEVTEGE